MSAMVIGNGKAVARRQSSPCTGKLSARPGKPGMDSLKRVCDDALFATACIPLQRTIPRRPVCVYKAWRNLSGPMWLKSQKQKPNQTLGWDRAAFRRSAPSPGSRTCRKGHAPSHRPQMSSGRLFLERVARQQSPSPLHRHSQNITRSATAWVKEDISTLPGGGHFYFALTSVSAALTSGLPRHKITRRIHAAADPDR
jgi:hypothetical protein